MWWRIERSILERPRGRGGKLRDVSEHRDGERIMGNNGSERAHVGTGDLSSTHLPFANRYVPEEVTRLGSQVEAKIFGGKLDIEIAPIRDMRSKPTQNNGSLLRTVLQPLVNTIKWNNVAFNWL